MEEQQKTARGMIINFYENPKSEDNGYRGIHFYLQKSTKTFPVEIQVWDYKAALEVLYKHMKGENDDE